MRRIAVIVWGLPLTLVFISAPGLSHPDPLENIKIYSYILESSPENAYAYVNRGICYRMVFDYEKAIEDFNRAEELGIDSPMLVLNRAMAFLPVRKYGEAMADLNQVIEREPENPVYYFYRGELHYREGRYSQAVEDYSKALDLRPAAHLYFVRGDAHKQLGKFSEALADYSKASEMRPYAVGFLISKAQTLGAMDRFEEARETLNKAVEKQPERYQIYMERAVLSASQNHEASRTQDIKLALRYIEDELFFQPKESKIYADRAEVHEMSGNLAGARDDLDRSVEFGGNSQPKYLRLRADFLERQGDVESASADRARAREIENRPVPTATPLPGPTLSPQELLAAPTPNLLPGLVE